MTREHNTLEDAALVRYLDGESPAEERARVAAAAASDPGVAARLDALRRRSDRLRAMLAGEDPALPGGLATFTPATRGPEANADVRWGRPEQTAADTAAGAIVPLRPPGAGRASVVWLRAAAIIVLVVGAALAVAPVRAWIIDGLERAGLLGGTTPPAPVAPVDTLGISGFALTDPFTIEVDHLQREGRLVVRIADGPESAAELHTRGGGESFFVLPDGLRIVNHDASRADYVVTLPLGPRSIRVRIPGAADTTWVASAAAEHVFSLRD